MRFLIGSKPGQLGVRNLHALPEQLQPATQVYCVNWNVVRRNTFLTGSWDDTIKLWDLNSPASIATFKEHTYCVYAATWWGPPHFRPASVNRTHPRARHALLFCKSLKAANPTHACRLSVLLRHRSVAHGRIGSVQT